MDWALSETGPKLSTAMVTGPMPRKPKATRPKAKTGAAKTKFRRHQSHDGRIFRYQIGDKHQKHDGQAFPESGEVTGNQPERMFSEAPPCWEALTTSSQWRDLVLVNTLVNSGIKAPAMVPQLMMIERAHHKPSYLSVKIAQQKIAGDEGDDDGNNRGDPDQIGQGMFKVEILLAVKRRFADNIIDKIRSERGQDHEDSHGKNPDDQFAAHFGISGQSQGQEGDQGDAGYAVSFKTVRRGANAVASIVTGTVGNNTGVFGIVFRKMEDDLHQVGADIGDLGEDTAADTQSASAQRFTDGKTDKAGTGQFLGNVSKNEDHEEKFDADQQKPNAHAGT